MILFRIELPLILGGVLAGALFAFVTVFDDVVLAVFVAPLGSQTLPLKMEILSFGRHAVTVRLTSPLMNDITEPSWLRSIAGVVPRSEHESHNHLPLSVEPKITLMLDVSEGAGKPNWLYVPVRTALVALFRNSYSVCLTRTVPALRAVSIAIAS